MKTVTAALVVALSLPVFAGPDFWLIEKGAAHARLRLQGCGRLPPDKLVLPLDHDPRAQTTPYLNERRKQRYGEQLRNCESARLPATSGASGSTVGAS